jgi:hypothetical protein
MPLASLSDMRATDARESVRAFAERRKCWHIENVATSVTVVTNGVRSESEGAMKSDDEWVNLVKGILRAEMARRGITYEQLAAKLAEIGVQDTAVNIRNKVARSGFAAVFFIQCLKALGCQTIRLDGQ